MLRPTRLWTAAVAVLIVVAGGCGEQVNTSSPPPFAVLSAFPAELAPHLERAIVSKKMVVDGHVFHVGAIDGVPVILALTGIGLVNAAATTHTLLEQFEVRGVIVSAVAGSPSLRIGDVAVPAMWATTDGVSYASDPAWLDLAGEIAAPGVVSLEHCTTVPPADAQGLVCLAYEPTVAVGGVGRSSDPFGGTPFHCQPNGGDVFGCDVASIAAPAAAGHRTVETLASDDSGAPILEDMETAAIAGEAVARGVPFIAFRAVSDGPGDPLGLPGFPRQFFAYYHLAARNAATAVVAFLKVAAVIPRAGATRTRPPRG